MDILQSQIKESCSLALPDGLKELMSDISREVLRSQPNDLLQFIADYLGALLEVRTKLSIACHICNDTFKYTCEPGLYDELKAIGLMEEDIESASKVIEDHFEKGNVKEQTLLIKLAKKISIDEMQLSSLREVVQKAFKQYHFKQDILGSHVHKDEEVTNAIHHTLDFYKHGQVTDDVLILNAYEPCASNVSSTSLTGSSPKVQYGPIYHPDNDSLLTDREYASYQYVADQSTFTGKVKFIEERVIYNIEHKYEKETNLTVIGDSDVYDDENGDNNNNEDNNDIWGEGDDVDDKANYEKHLDNNLTDNTIEEMIRSEFRDDSTSSVDEDFALDPENISIASIATL